MYLQCTLHFHSGLVPFHTAPECALAVYSAGLQCTSGCLCNVHCTCRVHQRVHLECTRHVHSAPVSLYNVHPVCKFSALCTTLTHKVVQIDLLPHVVRTYSAACVQRMRQQRHCCVEKLLKFSTFRNFPGHQVPLWHLPVRKLRITAILEHINVPLVMPTNVRASRVTWTDGDRCGCFTV